jgi:hypothetical protein
MKVRREITLALENVPGQLAHVCECLAQRKVNITAISAVETANIGLVRMVVDKPAVAIKMLKECCPITVSTCDVLELSMPNKPGALLAVARRLARKKINIVYLYGTATGQLRTGIIVRPSDMKKATRLLKGM